MWPVKKQYLSLYMLPFPKLRALSDSVSLSVTAPTHSLSPSVVRSTSNCDFTLQCVKHSCQSLVRLIVTYSFIIFLFVSKLLFSIVCSISSCQRA